MRASPLSITLLVALLLWPVAAHPATLAPEEAPSHVGERATVCGVVASAAYAARSNGQPTFLNLGKPYPDQIFTAVIWGDDRSKFGSPESTLRGKNICVTGEIKLYRGKPEIILRDSKQLSE
jgi:DNA/RNA endonuclease YhcR with UshA esterase domain